MDRRAVLAGAASLPVWLSLGFGQTSGTRTSAVAGKDMKIPIERARGIGKPLLVLLVPADPTQTSLRGQMWGHYLANLSDDQALDLALCEVICAREADIASVLRRGKLEGVDETTWAVLLETDSDPVKPVLVRGKLPSPQTAGFEGPSPELRPALEKLLRSAIVPDEAAQQRRMAQAVLVTPNGTKIGAMESEDAFAQFESIGGDGPVRRRDLDRWAARVRFVKIPDMGEFKVLDRRPMLADAARIRLFEQSPDGAQWMTSTMYCPPCGMGRVPPGSRFFLKFFTQ